MENKGKLMRKKGKQPMKTSREFFKGLNHARQALLFAAAIVMLSMAACGKASTTADTSTTSNTATPSAGPATFMFVQSADDLKVDPAKSTFRLVKVNPQTLYFSDRPQRIAGHVKMPEYLAEWTRADGPDNFSKNPPNATLSAYEPGQADNTLAVLKITNPVVDGNDLVYSYKLIEGTMPKAGGATALFIDSVGVGGGVGAGYHGVGVGGRGAGVR